MAGFVFGINLIIKRFCGQLSVQLSGFAIQAGAVVVVYAVG